MKFDLQALDHTAFMQEALQEARLAMQAGERPIGAVVVHRGKIVGRGRAQHITRRSYLGHAELNALLDCANRLYPFPHDNAVIYTTVEPCEMCLGAIVMSNAVNHVFFALADRWINPAAMLEMPHVRRHIHTYQGGLLEQESIALFQESRPDELEMMLNGRRPGEG